MLDRLDWIRLQPQRWLHWHPVAGGWNTHQALLARYPHATAEIEQSAAEQAYAQTLGGEGWWSQLMRWTQRTARNRQRTPDGVQMLWANMALHHSADPQQLIARWHELLSADGFLMFTTLGPDTLRELRALYSSLGWPPAGHEFTDMHDWGDMLVAQGFAEPVMDMEHITLTFDAAPRMLQELRQLGRNLHPARFSTLKGRAWHAQLLKGIEHAFTRTADGRLALTFEVIYGHAIKPQPRLSMQPQTHIPVQVLRDSLSARAKAPGRR